MAFTNVIWLRQTLEATLVLGVTATDFVVIPLITETKLSLALAKIENDADYRSIVTKIAAFLVKQHKRYSETSQNMEQKFIRVKFYGEYENWAKSIENLVSEWHVPGLPKNNEAGSLGRVIELLVHRVMHVEDLALALLGEVKKADRFLGVEEGREIFIESLGQDFAYLAEDPEGIKETKTEEDEEIVVDDTEGEEEDETRDGSASEGGGESEAQDEENQEDAEDEEAEDKGGHEVESDEEDVVDEPAPSYSNTPGALELLRRLELDLAPYDKHLEEEGAQIAKLSEPLMLLGHSISSPKDMIHALAEIEDIDLYRSAVQKVAAELYTLYKKVESRVGKKRKRDVLEL